MSWSILTDNQDPVLIRVWPELSSFSRAYTVYAGGRGSRAAACVLKMSLLHCDFENGSQNQHFQSTLLVGGKGSQRGSSYVRSW